VGADVRDDEFRALEREVLAGDALALERLKAEIARRAAWGQLPAEELEKYHERNCEHYRTIKLIKEVCYRTPFEAIRIPLDALGNPEEPDLSTNYSQARDALRKFEAFFLRQLYDQRRRWGPA